VNRLKTSKAKLNAQAEAHKAEVEDLQKKLAEINEIFEVAKAKQEISEMEKARVQKNIEELRDSKEKCYEVSVECAKKLKESFAKVGAYSSEQNLSVVIPKGLSSGLAKRSKLLKKFSATVGTFVPSPVRKGLQEFWKKLVANISRLQPR
jgi:chromosome segregation ATPase